MVSDRFRAVWIYAIIWAFNWIRGFIKYYKKYKKKMIKERMERIFAVRDDIDGYITRCGVKCYQDEDGSRYFISEGKIIKEKDIFSMMVRDKDFDKMIGFFEMIHEKNSPTINVIKEEDAEEGSK